MLLTVFAALQIGRRLLAAMGRGCLACVLTSGRWFSESALMICFSQCETVFCTLEFPGTVSQCRYSLLFSRLPFPAIVSFCGSRVFQFIGISAKKKKKKNHLGSWRPSLSFCVCMHECVCVCMWGRDIPEREWESPLTLQFYAYAIQILYEIKILDISFQM